MMKVPKIAWLLGAFALISAHSAIAQQQDVPPGIDNLMREMSDFVSSSRLFSFEVIDSVDDVLESGQKIQYSHKRNVIVNRKENKIRINTSGDIINRSFWKD